MSRFLGIILAVVGVAALVGAAIGWRFPFLGQSRSSNQLETAQESPTTGQPATRTRVQRSSQPTTTTTTQAQAQTNRTTAQAPAQAQTSTQDDVTIDPEGTAGTGNTQAPSTQPVRALW